MSDLALFLLGPPRIELGGLPVHIPRHKAVALLAYLALDKQLHTRDALATMFWPDLDQSHARGMLRRALSLLNRTLGHGWLTVDGETVGWNPDADPSPRIDVDLLRQRLAAPKRHGHTEQDLCPECASLLDEAVDLYGDGFLAGYSLPDSPAFDEWQFFEGESLRDEFARALQRLAGWCSANDDYDRAIPYARRWLALDPLHEPAHRALMRLYAQSGQRAAALRQYEECERLLKEELGVDPQEATQTLYEAIRSGELDAERHKEAATSPILNIANHNLPERVTSFIGRQKEMGDLEALLSDPAIRLVTVVGAGGMGKTRLATESAHHLLERAFAETWLVELAPVPDDDSVPRTVASALGVQEQPGHALPEVIAASLQTRNLLLVLDNCEHVLDGAAQLAALLTARCPDLTVLATSREPLHVPGEHLYEVPPMVLPADNEDNAALGAADAIRLFSDRAAAVQPGFTLDGETTPLAANVCRRLDGMPLAIELAAARMRALSIPEIARQLDDRFRLLTGGSRTALPRQRTLRNAVEWSYDLLDEAERTLFDRLSVFAGTFSLAGAEEVCSGEGVQQEDVLDLVASLVDKSLVTTMEGPAGTTRYRLLETLRAYGQQRLAARGETDEMARRHAWFCVDVAEREEPILYEKDEGMIPSLERLDAEAENLAAAMRWSLASGQPEVALRIGGATRWWIMMRAHFAQYSEWLQRTLARDDGIAPTYRAKALLTVALYALNAGLRDQWAWAAEEALALAFEAEDLGLIGWALYFIGWGSPEGGQLERSRACLDYALEIARVQGDRSLSAHASIALVFVHAQTLAESKTLFEEIIPQIPYCLRCFVAQGTGEAALALGKLDEAETWLQEAARGWAELDNLSIVGGNLSLVAQIVNARGDYARARDLEVRALHLMRQYGIIRHYLLVGARISYPAWTRGDHELAQTRLAEVADLAREHQYSRQAAQAQALLALVACEQGAYDRAEELCRKAQDGLPEGDQSGMSFARFALARVALCCDDAARAVELYRGCLDDPVRRQHRLDTVEALECLAWALAADGQYREATGLLAVTARERDEMGMVLLPVDRPHHERAMETLRVALDETAFAAAWATGEGLSLDETVARALGSSFAQRGT